MALAKVFGLLLMVVCFVALADAGPPKKDKVEIITSKTDDEEDFQEADEVSVEELLLELLSFIEPQTIPSQMDLGKWCSCTGLVCKCCLKIDTTLLTAEICLAFEYFPADKTASTYVTVRGKTLYTKSFPVSDPLKLCFGFKKVKICLELYGIKDETKTFTACVRDSMYVVPKRVISYDFGCFTLNITQSAGRPQLPKTTSKPKSKPKLMG
jgi:hypothetical protein